MRFQFYILTPYFLYFNPLFTPMTEPTENTTPTNTTPPASVLHTPVRTELLVVVGAAIVIAVIAFLFMSNNAPIDTIEQPTNTQPVAEAPKTLTISKTALTMKQGGVMENLTVTYGGKDVTQDAFWYSDDPSIALVGNNAPIKGQVSAPGKGETVVRAVYQEMNAEAKITVEGARLSVDCSMVPQEAKVGQEVSMNAYYTQIGTPFYSYEWSDNRGIIARTAVATTTYTTAGLKTVHFRTADVARNEAEMDCPINVTN